MVPIRPLDGHVAFASEACAGLGSVKVWRPTPCPYGGGPFRPEVGDLPTNTKRDRKASERALPQGDVGHLASVSSRDTSLQWPSTVHLAVRPAGEPEAGNPLVRNLPHSGVRRSPLNRLNQDC